jgi:predicted ATPase
MKSSPAMLRAADQVLAITSEQGYASWLATGNIMRGWCLSTLGRVAEGIPLLLQGIAAVGGTGAKLVIPQYLTILAEAYGLASQPEDGLRQLDDAERLMEKTQERWAEAEMHRLRGTLLLSMHEQAAAEDSYHTAQPSDCGNQGFGLHQHVSANLAIDTSASAQAALSM